jgi:hypothetical protein
VKAKWLEMADDLGRRVLVRGLSTDEIPSLLGEPDARYDKPPRLWVYEMDDGGLGLSNHRGTVYLYFDPADRIERWVFNED